MRFFHPGTTDGRFVPGSSRRRRARLREQLLHERAAKDAANARKQADDKARFDAEIARAVATPWDFWGAPGRILAAEPCEARPHSLTPTDGALRIVQGCGYDPGNAAYRHHAAVNEHTKHASAFVRFGHTNPFCDLRQIDGDTRLNDARSAVWHADVIHSHVDYLLQARCGFKWRTRPEQLVIHHYHGTRWRTAREQQWPLLSMLEDDLAGAVVLGARLTLCELRPSRMQWMPIPVPVQRYKALVPKVRTPGPFRIAHSPTKAEYKGTADLIAAVDAVRRKGLKVDLQMIERRTHGDALAMKADADLTFDSFWLGIQGSGLEAGAMGQMVVAGDADVKMLYEQSEVGRCPYTFAGDRRELTEVIERAVVDQEYHTAQAKLVSKYVLKYHDYAAVAKRYERVISDAMKRPDVITKRARHVTA